MREPGPKPASAPLGSSGTSALTIPPPGRVVGWLSSPAPCRQARKLEINLMTAQVSALGHAIRAIVGKRPSTAVTTGGICAISERTRKERPRRDSDQRVRRAAQELNEQNRKRADRRFP